MSWRKVSETDLLATLSAKEIDAFRKSADFKSDPVDGQIRQVCAYVRGCIRTGGKAILSKGDDELPESLISPAMDFLRWQILTRMNVVVNDSRTKAYDNANELFDQLRRGEFVPESDAEAETSDDANNRAGSPATGKANPEKRLLD